MFNELIADVVNAALSAYIEGLTKDTFKLSLLTSNLEMNNVELYKYGLVQNNIPITIEKGLIKTIRSYIPWATFMTVPMVIKASDVMITCNCWCAKDTLFPSVKLLRDIKQHQIAAHEFFKSKIKSLLKIVSQSLFTNTITKIVSKAKLQIDRLNIRIEFGESDCFVFGFQFDRLIVDDVANPKNDLIERAFNINNISAYIDRNQTPLDCSNTAIFSQMMNNAINGQHDWIMLPGNMSGTVLMKDIDSEIQINTKTSKITMDLTDWQVEFLFDTLTRIPKFFKYLKGSLVIRNKNIISDPVAFWKFVDQTSRKINEKDAVRIGNFRTLFKYMRKYTAKWKQNPNPPEKPKIIQYYDIIMPYYNIILWRSMAENSRTGKITFKTMKKVIDQIDFDGQNIFVQLISRIHFNFRSPFLLCRIRSSTDPEGIVFNIQKPALHLGQINNGVAIDISCSALSMTRNGFVVLESQDTDNEDFKIHLELFNDNSKLVTRLAVDVFATNYTVDVIKLLNIQIPFNIYMILERIVKIIKHRAFIIPPVELSLNTLPTQVFLKMNGNDFLLVMEAFTISTSIFSAKDYVTKLNVSNTSITYGKHQQNKLLDNFNLECFITKKGAEMFVKPFSMELNWKNIDLLMSMLPKEIPYFDIDKILHILSIVPHYEFKINSPSALIHMKLPYGNLELTYNNAVVKAVVPELIADLEVDSFGISDVIVAKDIKIVIDKLIKMSVKKAEAKFFKLFEVLPKNIFDYLPDPLKLPPIPIDMHLKVFDVDCSLAEQKFIIHFSNFIGNNLENYETIKAITHVDNVTLDDYVFTDEFDVRGSLTVNNSLFFNINFDPVPLKLNDFLLMHLLSVPFRMDMILPDKLVVNATVNIPKLIIYDYIVVNGIDFDFTATINQLKGKLTAKGMDLMYSSVECEKEDLCIINFDLFNRESQYIINPCCLTIDAFSMIETILPVLLNSTIYFPPPMKIDLVLNPSKLKLVIPGSVIECGAEVLAKINTANFDTDAFVKNVYAKMNGSDIFSVPQLTVKGNFDNYVVDIDQTNISFSLWHFLCLIKSMKYFPSLEIPRFNFDSLNLPTATVNLKNVLIYLNQQSVSSKYGPTPLFIEAKNGIAKLKNNLLKFETDFKGEASLSWFERFNLISQSKLKFEFDIFNNVNINIDDPVSININKSNLSSLVNLVDFTSKKPGLMITNETSRSFVFMTEKINIIIDPHSTSFRNISPFSNEFEIVYENRKMSISCKDLLTKRVIKLPEFSAVAVYREGILSICPEVKLINNTSMKVILNDKIIECKDENEVKISHNSTEFEIRFMGHDEKHKISSVGETILTKENTYNLIAIPKKVDKHITVNIQSIFLICNKLPISANIFSKFSLNSNTVCVMPDGFVSLDKLTESNKYIQFEITIPSVTKKGKVKIDPTKNEGVLHLSLLDDTPASINYKIENRIIYISGSVAHNLTNIPLYIRSSQTKVKTNNANYEHSFTNNFVPEDDITLLDSNDKIFISPKYDISWKDINVTNNQVLHQLHLQNLPSQAMPVYIWHDDQEIFIVPAAVIVNKLDKDVFVDTFSTQKHKLSTNDGFVVSAVNTASVFKISFDDNKYSKPLNMISLSKDQTLFIGKELVEIKVKTINFVKNIFISKARPQSYKLHKIINNTYHSLSFRQTGLDEEFVDVEPYSTEYFVLQKYHQSINNIEIKIGGETLIVHCSTASFQKQFKDIYYSVNLSLFDGSSIVFDEDQIEVESDSVFDLSISMHEVMTKVFDIDHELAIFLLSNSNTDVCIEENGLKIVFTLSGMNLINKLSNAIFENVLFSDGCAKDFVVKVTAHLSGLVKIDYFTVEFGHTTAAIDLNFISQFLNLIPDNIPKFKNTYYASNQVVLQNIVPKTVLQSSLLQNYSVMKFADQDLSNIISSLLPEHFLNCFSVKNVKISPSKFTLSFQPHVENNLPKFLKCLPQVDNAVMNFKNPIFECKEVKSLWSILGGFKARSLIIAGFGLIKSTELVGLPSHNVKMYFTNKKKGLTIRMITTGISFVFTFLAYISNVLHILLNTETIVENNRAIWGVMSFFAAINAALHSLSGLRSFRPSVIFYCLLLFLTNIILAFVDLLFGVTDWTLHTLAGDVVPPRIVSDSDEISITDGILHTGSGLIPLDEVENVRHESKTVFIILASGREIPIEFEDSESAETFYEKINSEKPKYTE